MIAWGRMFVAAIVLAVVVSLAGTPGALAGGYGTLTGQFVLEGTVPERGVLVHKGDKAARDPDVCAKDNVPDDSLLIDPKSKGIANVFIFMSKAPSDIHPDLKQSHEKVVKFDQKGCQFIPHALILRTDQTIAILSDDPIQHNTHVNTIDNRGENTIVQAGDREGSTRWNFPIRERFVTKVNCDIHTWMSAWWLIVDHPYATVTDADGRFKIEKVPAGDQQFIAWHERAGWVFGKAKPQRSRTYSIPADGTKTIDVVKIPAAMLQKAN